MHATKSLQTVFLDLPPSCIEVCPFNRAAGYFLVGTYELQTEGPADPDSTAADQDDEHIPTTSQTRNGSIILFKWDFQRREMSVFCSVYKVTARICLIIVRSRLQTAPQPAAVLDLHFRPESELEPLISRVAAVYSDGKLRIMRFDHAKPEPSLQLDYTVDISSSDGVLLTFCAWHPSCPDVIAITTTAFEVLLLRLKEDGAIISRILVSRHSDQAWYVTMMASPSPAADKLFLFSGGDDSILNNSIYQLSEAPYSEPELVEDNTAFKGHGAGVTAILPLQLADGDPGSFLLLTGSYDEDIRLFTFQSDTLNMTNPPSLSLMKRLPLGGGVWRLSLVMFSSNPPAFLVLASCMHAGVRLVRILRDDVQGTGVWDMEVVQKFEEHESMNYGSDLIHPLKNSDAGICLSTSFYDRRLCAWEIVAT